jgi:translation initiation factor IF-2
MVTWMAEERQLMANAKRPARGTVIEAHLDKKIGPVATLLVQAGTLKVSGRQTTRAAVQKQGWAVFVRPTSCYVS